MNYPGYFEHDALRGLYHLLLVGPVEVRRRHVDRLERLLLHLSPEQTYPYDYLYFHITGFRPPDESPQAFTGEQIRRDLHVALELLSGSAPTDAREADEELYTPQAIAGKFNVTTRTVRRWRRRGLVGRVYVFPDGRRRIGVRKSALDAFAAREDNPLGRAMRFSHISAQEGRDIAAFISRLREKEGLSFTQALARAAGRFGRAQESLRLLLQRRGESERDERLSPDARPRLDLKARRRIYRQRLRGEPIERLSARFGRSRSTLYRIINQEKARDLLAEPSGFIHEERFEDRESETALENDWRALVRRIEREGAPAGLRPPLNAEEEKAIFRSYNWAKYCIHRGQQELNPKRYVSGLLVRRLLALARRAERIRAALATGYGQVMTRVARQHSSAAGDLASLLESGAAGLAEAIDSYDYRRAVRFGPYLQLELQKRFARLSEGRAEGPDAS